MLLLIKDITLKCVHLYNFIFLFRENITFSLFFHSVCFKDIALRLILDIPFNFRYYDDINGMIEFVPPSGSRKKNKKQWPGCTKVLPPPPHELSGHRNFFFIQWPGHKNNVFCGFPKEGYKTHFPQKSLREGGGERPYGWANKKPFAASLIQCKVGRIVILHVIQIILSKSRNSKSRNMDLTKACDIKTNTVLSIYLF